MLDVETALAALSLEAVAALVFAVGFLCGMPADLLLPAASEAC